jgi:hypothetical protein
MPVYNINQDKTVGEFLRKPSLSPSIENPDKRIPELIKCQGLVHYVRSGTRTVITDESYQLKNGDFIVAADQCSTGTSQTIVMDFKPTDYAFIMPTDNFGNNAENFMNRRPSTTAIKSTPGLDSLDAVLVIINSGAQITTPINDIIIVSHANAGGFLFFKLRNDSASEQISYNDLDDYINSSSRTQMTSRLIRDNGNILIRGCNIGKEPRFLNLVKKLFAGKAKVTAPKHLDRFAFFQSGNNFFRYESMLYNFEIYNKTAFSNKNQVVQAYSKHTPSFTDIFGKSITDAQYKEWIPADISSAETETNHKCNIPIDPKETINRIFKHHNDAHLFGYSVSLESNPPENNRINKLKEALKNDDKMKSTHPFPQYEQFGYTSLDEFVDNLNWSFRWDNSSSELICRGGRHRYQLRIPITDANNNLFVNSFQNSGNKQFVHHQILETDLRFFGSV